MICFFCLQPQSPSSEHVFPKAIGGTLTTDRVCKPCNDTLGHQVDVLLTDHLLIQLQRSDLGLAGQSGTVPDAINLVLGTTSMADDPAQRVRLLFNPASGKLEPRILPKRTTKVLPDGLREESLTIDASTPPEEVKRILLRLHKRQGVPPPSDETLNRKVAQILSQIVTIEKPEVMGSLQVDDVGYKRAMLKIAYELACLWLGDAYPADPTAATLRNVILGRTPFASSGIGAMADLVRLSAFDFWPPNTNSHLAYATVSDGRVGLALKVFETFFMVVHVTERAEDYEVQSTHSPRLRFLEIDVPTGARRESSFVEELTRLASRRGHSSTG